MEAWPCDCEKAILYNNLHSHLISSVSAEIWRTSLCCRFQILANSSPSSLLEDHVKPGDAFFNSTMLLIYLRALQLIGTPGVGKMAILKGFASRIVASEVPEARSSSIHLIFY